MKKQRMSAKQYFKELLLLFGIFLKIGAFCFGGGYAMLTLIEAEIVEKRPWITHNELADIFAIAESTPGPIAINTATYIGTKRLGILGGIVATLGVVLPSFVIIIALSYIINLVQENKWVQCLFKGIRVGVLVLISKAVISFFKDMRKNIFSFALMIVAFLLVFLTDIGVIYIILATILICSIAVAIKYFCRNKMYFVSSTTPYYCEQTGKHIEDGEYVSEGAVDKGLIKPMQEIDFAKVGEAANADDAQQGEATPVEEGGEAL